MQFFAWNCSNFGDIKTAMMTNFLVIWCVLNWILSEVSADRLELWVKQTSNFQVDRDGLGADEALAEGDAKRNQRNVGGWTFVSADLQMPWKQQTFLVPKSLGEKIQLSNKKQQHSWDFWAFCLSYQDFCWSIRYHLFLSNPPWWISSWGWFICHQACATPCHGEAQSLGGCVVGGSMLDVFVFMGILGANWHWHPWNKALKRGF